MKMRLYAVFSLIQLILLSQIWGYSFAAQAISSGQWAVDFSYSDLQLPSSSAVIKVQLVENGDPRQLKLIDVTASAAPFSGVPLDIKYHFEMEQNLTFGLYKNAKDSTPVAVADVPLAEILRKSKSYHMDFPFLDVEYQPQGMLHLALSSVVAVGGKDLSENQMFDHFMGAIAEGLQISVMFGIDFTSSNIRRGFHSVRDIPTHYRPGDALKNDYEYAIRKVGDILAVYDSDKQFPCLGYGASISSTRYFPAYFNLLSLKMGDKPECVGIDGVLNAYRAALPNLGFGDMGGADYKSRVPRKPYEGDDFIEVINAAAAAARQRTHGYDVLVLIIDGDGFDMQATKDAIINAEDAPLSIVIIGVGTGPFGHSEDFDADVPPGQDPRRHKLYHSDRTIQTRDTVQFVKFNDHRQDMKRLTSEVLKEIPRQFMDYQARKSDYATRGRKAMAQELMQQLAKQFDRPVASPVPVRVQATPAPVTRPAATKPDDGCCTLL